MLAIFIISAVVSTAQNQVKPLSDCSIILPNINSFTTVGTKIGLVDTIKALDLTDKTVATKYNSLQIERVKFAGAFTSSDPSLIIGIFSDDGVTVKIDGNIQNVNYCGQGQALPTITNSLKSLDGPWSTNVVHYMEIEYSNICHPDETDIDGLTVYFCGNATIIPITITLSSNKTSILTGGIETPLHQTTLTATVEPANLTGDVSFSVIQGEKGVNIDSDLSEKSCQITNGTAVSVLTSSDLASDSNTPTIIRASFLGCYADVNVTYSMATGVCLQSSPDVSTAGTLLLTLQLTFGGDNVSGHNIKWRIKEIYNSDSRLIYDTETDFDERDVNKNYGDITPKTDITTSTGFSTSVYTAGNEGCSLVFESIDTNTFYND